MSIHLYPKCGTHNYSTNEGCLNTCSQISAITSRSQSREFQAHSRNAFNMNDKQPRLKRLNHMLYQESTKEKQLFEKGVLKVQTKPQQPKQTSSMHRSYRNKQTYDVLNPSGQAPKSSVGVKKIKLYDQTRQSSDRYSCHSSRKISRNHNQRNGSETDYLLKRLPTHQNSSHQWINSHAYVNFQKRENLHNKENREENIEIERQKQKTKKTVKLFSSKNSSNLSMAENGVSLKTGKNRREQLRGVDFSQDYYKKVARIPRKYGNFHLPKTYR